MRLCIILLLVAVVLWLSGFLAASCQSDASLPDPNDAPELFGRIQSWMPTPPPLKKGDLKPTACLDFPYLRPSTSGACSVVVLEGEDTRATVVELVEGTARIAFTDNRRPDKSASTDLPAEVDGETTEELQLQISSDGGELRVRCREGKQCAVRLKPKSDD
jgi:hypothetical protein